MKMPRPAASLLALSLAAPLAGCPEQRSRTEVKPPPQATLAAGTAGAPDVLTLRRPAGPEYFGFYVGGKKAGWLRTDLTRELRDGKDVLVARETMVLKVKTDGRPVERRQEEERIFEARPGGRLLSFTADMRGDGGDRLLRGTCARGRCTVKVESPGRAPVERVLEVTVPSEQADPARLAAARRTTVRGPVIETLRIKVKQMETSFVRREKLVRGGAEEEVSVVAEQEVGDRMPLEYRIADDGRVLDIRQGDGLVVLPEPEARATSLEDVDLPLLGRVALPRPLPSDVPAKITYDLAGLPRPFWTNSERQRFEAGPNGTARLTVTARAPAAADPARDTPLAQAGRGADPADLAATGAVDSDAPEIVALAREIAGDAPGAYAAAKRLNEHVHRLLTTTMGASQDRASDVLRARQGDCSEHALLTVALARAIGIPAREVYGLVYSRMGGQEGLYWHDWVEIRSAGEWIAIDPTFGQPVADATHIALSGGDRSEVGGLLTALKVMAVEVHPPEATPQRAVRPASGVK
ncbi:MAG TPA: transglutaminase-like domain-containing protein [Anaeromyxobacter sp.]|nr:transglutaminase-like domain-containing protein [Anaeromyxobacter sp.]